MSALVDATLLTEPLGDEPRLAPGIYVARAQDPAYGGLEALAVEGHATYLGERHDPDGTKMIAVSVPGARDGEQAPNMGGAIRIGREFFTTALRDYHDWKEKWWREAIQNSVDAGATDIDCRVEQVPEGFAISVSDDGRGMDEDTLLNKFLVLGGTTKTRGDTRGGFGKAKELLVLPWLAWSIHTRDRKVVGAGLDYQVEPAPFRQGTEIRVVMPPDETTHESCALAFIEKCYLPDIRFTVNGTRHKARLAPGEELRSFEGKATLYYDKKGKNNGLFVRTMGLFMFEMWVSDAVKGTLVVELTGSSVELLTANRDGIRDYELKRGIERYVNELAADVSSALKKKKGLIRKRFEGTGKFTGANEQDLRSAMLNHMEELQPAQQTKRGLVLSEDQVSVLKGVVHELGAGEGSALVLEETVGALNMRTNAETAAAMLDSTVMPGPAAVEAAIKQLAWEPDFYLINDVEGFHVPKMFYPESLTPGVKKLAKAWAELCRFVLIQLGCATPFGVGFIFSHDAMAAYQQEDDEHWLLLNPFRDAAAVGSAKPSKEALWGLVTEDDVNQLYASAVHEVTHMADGVRYHDESFASALTRNFARCANKDRQVKAIIKSIKARGPRAEGVTPRARKSAALPSLADSEMEQERRRTTLSSGYRYSMFAGTYGPRESASDELSSETLNRGRGIRAVEWRDQQADGAAVWRSEDFDLPLAQKRGRASQLPELHDEYLRERRQEKAREYGSASVNYVAFMDSGVGVWDYSKDLETLIRIMESETQGSQFAEIRDVATGSPVWRSANFRLDIMPYAANRGSVGMHVSVADVDPDELLIGTEHELEHTDDPDEAERIALDHLAEDPRYYSRLAACGIDGNLTANAEHLYLEGPLGQGAPWTLHYGTQQAVLSEVAAVALAARYDIPIGQGIPGAIKDSPLGLDQSVYDEPIRLSQKAQRLLGAAGIAFRPNQVENDEEEGPHSWKPNAANRWGVDVRALNRWLKANAPGHARVVRHRGVHVDVGAEPGTDLRPVGAGLEQAFPGTRVDQPGFKNYLRVRFPEPDWLGR